MHRSVKSRQREAGRDRLLHIVWIARELLGLTPCRFTVVLDPASKILAAHPASIRAVSEPKTVVREIIGRTTLTGLLRGRERIEGEPSSG